MLNYCFMTEGRAQPRLTYFCCHGFQIKCFPDQTTTLFYSSSFYHTSYSASPIPLGYDSRWTEHKWLENTTCSVLNAGGTKQLCHWDGKHISLSSACQLYNRPWKFQVTEGVGWNIAWQIPVFYSGIHVWRLSSTAWLMRPLWNFL